MLATRSPQMRKAVGVLKELSADERARMLYEKREMARMDFESRIDGAIREEREAWQSVVADKDAAHAIALADKDAEIARLRAQLGQKHDLENDADGEPR